jgi:hypothetical protein
MSEWKSTACILCECTPSGRIQLAIPELDLPDASGGRVGTGVSPNELTRSEDRDWVAGTPWHKHTPARVEAL